MLNDFEANLIINEHDLPRSINEFVDDFEDSDVIHLETESDQSTTSKDGESIKLIKSFDFEDVRPDIRLKINSHIKLFNSGAAMESFNVESRVPELIEFSSELVGVKDE